jgi:hypothetical protein
VRILHCVWESDDRALVPGVRTVSAARFGKDLFEVKFYQPNSERASVIRELSYSEALRYAAHWCSVGKTL